MIYTASDLDRKRREVTNAARRGLAHIRDTDGTGLVLLRAHHYEVLETVSRWHDRLVMCLMNDLSVGQVNGWRTDTRVVRAGEYL